MPYILNKTNGTILTTVDDASLDNTTNLTFVGKNYAGYGEIVNENFVKLLENFANSTEPSKPVPGQLYFSTSKKNLNVYDGKKFKGIGHVEVSASTPISPVEGDLWWDSLNGQLRAYNTATGAFKLIGPVSSAARSSWDFAEELQLNDTTNTLVPVIKGKFGNNPVAVISNKKFATVSTSDLVSITNPNDSFSLVQRGITLVGANNLGSSKEAGTYFWGTAADSLHATTSSNVISVNTTSDELFYITFVSTSTLGRDSQVMTNGGLSYNPFTQAVSIVAASAKYADLAERYEADSTYDIGTVVVIGGTKEITVTHTHADVAVLGVVSERPAYIMNADAGPNTTHPCIALRGRVPCKVIGPVKKGDLLVTSATPGYAETMKASDRPVALLGKSLKDFNGPKGLVEIVI